MTIDKEKLKELAEAATDGVWQCEKDVQGRLHVTAGDFLDIAEVGYRSDPNPEADAQFIAAARPEVVLALLVEIERLATSRSKKERELEQELEVWCRGPFCWTCGDTGDVHDITGEWRGECDCLSAQLINANRERDQLKAENEALRKDAERYRWIRHRNLDTISQGGVFAGITPQNMVLNEETLDQAVDAAMTKEAQP